MRLTYLLILGCSLAALGLGLFYLSVNTYKNASITPGCHPLTTTGHFNPLETVAFWNGELITPRISPDLAAIPANVLGANTDAKRIEIDLSEQKLRAYEGDQLYLESPISSGLWNKTPVGEYRIWYKIASTKMEGGIKGHKSYYYLPNVPFAMFFHGHYGIHGTYWHNDFGRPRSHGCVNAPTPVAEKLFHWSQPALPAGKRLVRASNTNPGTRVIIKD